MTAPAIARQRAVTWLREQGERLYPALHGMSRRDAERWASAQDMADLGGLVVAWLHGEAAQTPGHCGPPCRETIPLIPALEAANRAGFVTDNSQRADDRMGRTCNTWVEGFASDATLDRLREAVAGTELVLVACRGRAHECRPPRRLFPRCPSGEVTDFWADACPDAADEIQAAWSVTIADPEPGRNDVLWPALEAFAAGRQS